MKMTDAMRPRILRDCVKLAPPDQKLMSLRRAKISPRSKQPFVCGGLDDDERKRDHGQNEKCSNEPRDPSPEPPCTSAAQKTDDREWRLHKGGAFVARLPF